MILLIKKIKRKIFSIIKKALVLTFCTLKDPLNIFKYYKIFKISNTKCRKIGSTSLLGGNLFFIDSNTFVSMYNEIFKKEIYKFKTFSSAPYIIDGGANIGLATIYFKKTYPNSHIVSFEPDKTISKIFKKNIDSLKLDRVDIIEKGLWNKDGKLTFYSEGTDSGRIQEEKIYGKTIEIEVTSLRPYLNKPVDFLKLDIEGAETLVLEDCKDLLFNIKNLFIEYHSFEKKDQTLNILLEIIRSAGFRYYLETVGVTSTNPFVKINSYLDMDLQINIYAYRE